jgi:hypothetical protein
MPFWDILRSRYITFQSLVLRTAWEFVVDDIYCFATKVFCQFNIVNLSPITSMIQSITEARLFGQHCCARLWWVSYLQESPSIKTSAYLMPSPSRI